VIGLRKSESYVTMRCLLEKIKPYNTLRTFGNIRSHSCFSPSFVIVLVFVCLFVCCFVYVLVCLFVCLFSCLYFFIYLFVRLFVYLLVNLLGFSSLVHNCFELSSDLKGTSCITITKYDLIYGD